MAATVQTFEFQAETAQLLDLMIHSLYTNKDIFLRELISNASDALDQLRFQSLTNPDLLEGNDKFEIRLEIDKTARTLTVIDSGIGMSREELISNIGTIARSSTRELRQKLKDSPSPMAATELIGQFGVGFYSAFMVADRVKVITRRAGQTEATEWQSAGDGKYTIEDAERAERGTSVILYLKTPDTEAGMDDFSDQWRISSIVRRYSDFINYPILMKEERPDDKDGKTVTVEDRTLNSMKPLWRRPAAEVTNEEYNEFYKHISHNWDEPLKVIHFRAEGTFEYDALLYVPSQAPHDLYYAGSESGLQLFARRVRILEETPDLLPHYLRFIKGLVNASDLPLNISRQKLQQDHHVSLIRKRLTRKVLEALQELFDKDYEKYLTFWSSFGKAMKEAVSSDFENKERILPLLLFQSSHDPEKWTTLRGYVERMKPAQEQIFYLTGDSRNAVEHSPHLEALKEEGLEVLYMVDPVDELLLQYLPEFDGKKLKSAGKGSLNVGDEAELKKQEEESKDFLDFLQKTLTDTVKQVRLTNRLTNSPICLVVEDHDYSPMLERVLQRGKGGPKQKRVLELNPKHPLVEKLLKRYQEDAQDPMLERSATFLHDLALLAEGSELSDPVRFNRVASEILGQAL